MERTSTCPGSLIAIVVAAVCQTVAGLALGLYLGRWRFGTLDEVSHLVGTVAITTAALAAVNLLNQPLLVPASVTLAAGDARPHLHERPSLRLAPDARTPACARAATA